MLLQPIYTSFFGVIITYTTCFNTMFCKIYLYIFLTTITSLVLYWKATPIDHCWNSPTLSSQMLFSDLGSISFHIHFSLKIRDKNILGGCSITKRSKLLKIKFITDNKLNFKRHTIYSNQETINEINSLD